MGESLLLIDAYSQIFRSFYAIRHLTNRRGEPVNAAFVFAKLLLKLEKRYPERRSIMLFDSGKVAFRLELAPEYKANRPPMPDELKSQMPLIKRIAAAFGWNLFSCEGYEAEKTELYETVGGIIDDIVAAAQKAAEESATEETGNVTNEEVVTDEG